MAAVSANEVLTQSTEGWHYTLRRSRRARRLRVQYSPENGLIVVLPQWASRADGEAFLCAQRDWILACHRSDPNGLDRPRPEHALPVEVVLRATGECLDVESVGDLATLHETLRCHAAGVLPKWVGHHSAGTGLGYERVRVRNQRSRWGSYSSKGTVSLNWRLLLLTPDMVDYVILHELAHSRHMNHSGAFWQLLESICPGARARDGAFDRLAYALLPAWSRL